MTSHQIILPKVSKPAANYQPFLIHQNIVYISGQLPFKDGVLPEEYKGHLGQNISVEQGIEIARQCGLNILAQLGAAIEHEWSRVERCLKLGVFVASTPDFTQQPQVANGASDLMVEFLGQNVGPHARFAVGVSVLPLNTAVEIDAQFAVSS